MMSWFEKDNINDELIEEIILNNITVHELICFLNIAADEGDPDLIMGFCKLSENDVFRLVKRFKMQSNPQKYDY
jgi:hypothetical protein